MPIRIDMGPNPNLTDGSLACRAETRDEAFAWSGGIVRDQLRSGESDAWLAGFVESNDATFLIAVEPPDANYSVTLTLGDPTTPRGPVSLLVNNNPMTEASPTRAGESQVIVLQVTPDNGRIAIRMTTDCGGFALAGIVINGPPGALLGTLFPDNPLPGPVPVPSPELLPIVTEAGLYQTLREFCDFLVESQPRQGGFSYQGAWYQNAYAIRMLMAGSRLLDEPSWSQPALACLDLFVAQQGEDANWLSSYHVGTDCLSRPGCPIRFFVKRSASRAIHPPRAGILHFRQPAMPASVWPRLFPTGRPTSFTQSPPIIGSNPCSAPRKIG